MSLEPVAALVRVPLAQIAALDTQVDAPEKRLRHRADDRSRPIVAAGRG